MSDISIDTSELQALARELAAAGVKTEALASAKLSEIANKAKADAVSFAPQRTGDLKASIYLRGGKDWRIVGSDIRYAQFVEWGTSDTSPQPFINPAAAKAGERLYAEFQKLADPLG